MYVYRAPPSYLDLFRTKEMRMITILITILWMLIRLTFGIESIFETWNNIYSLEFDCTVRNITNLDFSIYVSFCVSCHKYVQGICNCTYINRHQSCLGWISDISCSWVPCWSALHCGTRVIGKKVKTSNSHERKKINSCLSGGQLPFPCWLSVWPSCPALGLPTSPCLRQSLPWLEDSLPPLPWTLDFSSLLRWFEEENNHRSLVFPGATDHPEGPGYGSVPNDVHGWPSCIAPYRLLG